MSGTFFSVLSGQQPVFGAGDVDVAEPKGGGAGAGSRGHDAAAAALALAQYVATCVV